MSDLDEDRHQILGTIVEDDIPRIINLPPPPTVESPLLSEYCDSCGHVDSHASGCPRGDALQALHAMDLEDAADDVTDILAPEPVIPLVRRIGASLLRRVAIIVAPKKADYD